MDQAKGQGTRISDEVKEFYKGDFKQILRTFFQNPIDGIYSIFESPSNKAYIQSLIMFASIFVLYFIGWNIILGGEMKSRLDMDMSDFLRVSLIPIVIMLLISIVSFGLKSYFGESNFKSELLTGALTGIPLGIMMAFFIVYSIFLSEGEMRDIMMSFFNIGRFGILVVFFAILMMINVLQQSLKSSGAQDAVAWYLSPIVVLLCIYFSFKILF